MQVAQDRSEAGGPRGEIDPAERDSTCADFVAATRGSEGLCSVEVVDTATLATKPGLAVAEL